MKKVVSYFFLLGLIALGCKEDDGPTMSSYSESPRFYVNASLNGLPLSLVAGEQGYQIYTSFKTVDSVLEMKGIIARDTADLRNALVLTIKGSDLISPLSTPHPGTVFNLGPLSLSDPSGMTILPDHFDYHFFADTVNGHIPLQWTAPNRSYYGDSCSIMGLNSLTKPIFNIEMSSIGPLTCTPSVKHTIQTGGDCKAQVHVLKSTSSELEVEAQARVGVIKKVQWQVAGQNVGQGNRLSYSVVGFQAGYRVKGEIEFESGCKETIEKVILPGSPTCDINIDYRKEVHRQLNPHNLATVELQYFDADGKRYSTAYTNTQGRFNIESINDYHDANSQYNHQRFSFSGEAILKSPDGSNLQLNNIFGSFAVAHP